MINDDIDVHGSYYRLFRQELIPFLRGCRGSVLDVGCGSGELLKHLKRNGAARTIAVEMRADVAEGLRQSELIDEVQSLDIETEDLHLEEASLDAIVVSHVLEHMVNPWKVLRTLRRYLKDDGILVGAIPNVRHIAVSGSLILKGRWRYHDSGILDATHLRFFTRDTIRQLLESSGFAVQTLAPEISGPRATLISKLSLHALDDLVAYAYNFRCSKANHAVGEPPI